MTWEDHYEKIEIKSHLEYFFPTSLNEYIIMYLSLIFISISYFFPNSITLFMFSSFILICFSIFIHKSLISLYYMKDVVIFYCKDENHLIGFKQIDYLKEYNNLINNKKKHEERKKIFFITFLGEKEKTITKKKRIFIILLKYLRRYKYIISLIIILLHFRQNHPVFSYPPPTITSHNTLFS